ncbi:MAG: ABC transporter substrate-binding protein [Actinomycetaceae bacterium]|nr:ABC transporter substrate-binding protein [Actinomycetaceae bacterium]
MIPRPRRKNFFHAISAAIAATAAIALTACTPGGNTPASGAAPTSGSTQGGASSVTIGLTYIPNVQFSPVYVAKKEGIYRAAGIDATIRHHGNKEGLFTALTSGEEDVVVASGDEMLQAREAGMDLVSIGTYYHTHPVVTIVPEDSTIKTIADLKGKRIGVPGQSGSNWYSLLSMLSHAGLTQNDVTVIPVGFNQQAALAQKEVDAAVGFVNNDFVQMKQAGMKVRTLDIPEGTIPLVSSSIITTRKWLDENPDQAKAVVDATVSGIDRVIENPQHAIEATQEHDPALSGDAAVNARAVLDSTIPLWKTADGKTSGKQNRALWTSMGNFYLTVPEVLNEKPDLEQAVVDVASR